MHQHPASASVRAKPINKALALYIRHKMLQPAAPLSNSDTRTSISGSQAAQKNSIAMQQ